MSSSQRSSKSRRSGRVALDRLVPLTARATLFYDIRSAPLNGIYLGVMSLLPWVLRDTLHGSDWEVAVLSAVPNVAHLLDIWYAHLCANRRKMPFVLWPGLVARFLIVLSGLALNSVMFLVMASVSYVVACVSTPAVNSIWRGNYPGSHRYKVLGTVLAVMHLSSAATAFAAGLLLRSVTVPWLYRAVFVTGGAVGMLGVVVFSRIRVRGERPGGDEVFGDVERFNPFRSLGLLWRDRKFGKYMLVQFMSGFSNMMTVPVLVALLKLQRADWLKAALALGVAPSLVTAVLMPVWGRVLQRFNPLQARSFFNFLWAGGFLMIARSGLDVNWVIGARLLMGAAMGATTLLWTLQQMYFARKEDVPKYMGVHCTLTGIRGLVAPFLGVTIMKAWQDPHLVFYLAAAGLMCAGFLSLTMAGREPGGKRGHVDGGAQEG